MTTALDILTYNQEALGIESPVVAYCHPDLVSHIEADMVCRVMNEAGPLSRRLGTYVPEWEWIECKRVAE